ncbi:MULTISPECIES: deoxyribose-phosphate aldolase [Gammaproteobacteria]|uniref:deoxyribose-phosphate aldolase n=1 Tax=Gammaproteobacteria TaxID=1236 RepID=UPI000DCFA8CE|nr:MULTISPECIES: deoxyribose-phosphate aldolase [Gammaproteobacteria]RTE86552.1 deoxyribose-phosphate aldolase [Aliidiomarina sp. B3213]TCZ90893.1 deoxyribose-phosphate aldolase [Lysobacter sp. N42]
MNLPSIELAAQAFSFLDLTSLTDQETVSDIEQLADDASLLLPSGELIHVAALCVFPRFIPYARAALDARELFKVKIATVTNFPHGGDNIDIAVAETQAAVAYGADEVDVVFPYRAFLAGNEVLAKQLVQACKAACGTYVQLKVILETGELGSEENIARASNIALEAGADFIKTSTGKVTVNATAQAAEVMLNEIAKRSPSHHGFKPAGGIRTLSDALTYMNLVSEILSPDALTPARFRIGASSVRGDLAAVLTGSENKNQGDY